MFFSISASQRPWISAIFAVLGVICEVTGHHDVAVSLITASITIATLAQKDEGGPERLAGRSPRRAAPPELPQAKSLPEDKPE